MKLQGYIRTAPFSTATSVPGYLPPATSPTTCIGRQLQPRDKAAWRRSRRNASWRALRAKAKPPWQPNDSRKKVQMIMDWDKLKVFHAAAEAGSFTHAGERLGLSQSAVSRQVSALEQELGVSLFHRHARGLILTEQGELLHHTAHDVHEARSRARQAHRQPRAERRAKVQTTPGIGVHWLTPRLGEFIDLYPDIRITLITTDEELDLAMREADVAIRLRQPTQPGPDPAQAVLGALPRLCLAGIPSSDSARARVDDLDNHRLCCSAARRSQSFENRRWLVEIARNGKGPRPTLTINNVLGVMRACQRGIGVALLPDYLVEENGGLVQLFGESDLHRARRFRIP